MRGPLTAEQPLRGERLGRPLRDLTRQPGRAGKFVRGDKLGPRPGGRRVLDDVVIAADGQVPRAGIDVRQHESPARAKA